MVMVYCHNNEIKILFLKLISIICVHIINSFIILGVYSFIMKDFSVPGPVYTPPYCYNGKGRGYTGQVSVTESGHTCQVWGTKYPHPNYILPQQYWELCKYKLLINVIAHCLFLIDSPVTGQPHNYCRNPGERGERPWCFTTNRTVRWEYCNIPKCGE